MKASRTILSILGLVFVVATTTAARADMGSVWVDAVTADTITIDCSKPVPLSGHRLVDSVYRVTWQEVSPYPYQSSYSSSKHSEETSSMPFVIQELNAGSWYKIAVTAQSERITPYVYPGNKNGKSRVTVR
jgi:hypothetical protein